MAGSFNAPGFSDEYIKSHPGFHQMGDRITEFQGEKDFVSSIGRHPTDGIIVEDNGADAAGHDLASLAFDGEKAQRSESGNKSALCYMVTGITLMTDFVIRDNHVLDAIVKSTLDLVYSPLGQAGLKSAGLLIAAWAIAFAIVNPVAAAAFIMVAILLTSPEFVDFVEDVGEAIAWVANKAVEIARKTVDMAVAAGLWTIQFGVKVFDAMRNAIIDITAKLKDWMKGVFDGIREWGTATREVLRVDLPRLHSALGHLNSARRRIRTIDQRLDVMRSLMDATDAGTRIAVGWMDLRVGGTGSVTRCSDYVSRTVSIFESAEAGLVRSASSLGGR